MIHSGNCDCPFPGRGCAWEVPAAFSGGPRLPFAPGGARWPARIPARPERRRKGQVRPLALAPARPPPAAVAGRPGAPAPPALALFVTARLPVCGRRPRLTSRAGKPPKAASFSEPRPPAGLRLCLPGSRPQPGARAGPRPREAGAAGGWPAGPAPGTRGRCAAVGAVVPSGARAIGPATSAWGQSSRKSKSVRVFVPRSSVQAPYP